MKNIIVEAVNIWKQNPDNRFRGWLLADEIKEKHRAKIAQGFGAEIPHEKWIALYDTTIIKNGKKGLLFTEENLYLDKGEVLPLSEVEAVYKIDFIHFLVKLSDGSYKGYEGNQEAVPVLQLMTGIEQAQEPPKEAYQELHTTYRRELRRRMNTVTKDICSKNDRFVSIELADEAFVENALERWDGIDRSKILAFLKTTHGNGKEAIIISEDAIYAGMKEQVEIPLDGLIHTHLSKDGVHYILLYSNNYVYHQYFFVYESDKDTFQELLDGYSSIYEDLKKEIEAGQVSMSGLDLADGLKKYLDQRDELITDTYKNAVFVSSTFRDMHFERDIIHERVQPALSALADQYGETISFCDLRWGVNTENLDSEDGAKKVLIVCLDEIEKCKPYMLIMLGERYGWIPSETTIKNALENRTDFTLDELEKSVTALEIEYGALTKQTDRERIFVYFREMDHAPSEDYASEDEYHKEKLNQLKERVRKLAPDRVKTYKLSWDAKNQNMNGAEAFAQMVTQDIGAAMEQVWSQKEEKTPLELELQQHMSYMKKKSSLCYGREDLLASCIGVLEDRYHLLALIGESGCGKSTVMGALAHILKNSDVNVLPIFCGLTKQTESAIGIIQYLCCYLEEALCKPRLLEKKKVEDVSEEYWVQYLVELTADYSKETEKPLMILLDAVDQLMPDNLRNNLKFIPVTADRLDSKVYMVLSCLPDFELAAFPAKIEVTRLDETVKSYVIEGILKKNRRELDEEVIRQIMNKSASDSPLYLTLLIQRLLMMNKNDFADIMADGDGMSAITKHQLDIVVNCGDDILTICREMIEVSAERIGGDFVKQAIAFLAVSKHGLRECDLEGLLIADGISWNRLEFSLFINYLRNIFILREDGCYDFSHKVFRQIFIYEEEKQRELHRKLFCWLEHLPENDFLRERELLSHCLAARESRAFIHHVAGNMRDERDVKELTQQMLQLCRQDEGAWLVQLIRLIEIDKMTDEDISFFLRYVTEKIGRAFTNSTEDLAIREKLFLELQPVAEYLAQAEGGMEHERRVGVVFARLGKIYELNQDYGVSEIYNKKTLAHSLILKERYPNEKTAADISIDYRMLGNLYLKMSGREEEALSYFEQSVQSAEAAYEEFPDSPYVRRVLGWSYKRLGDYHSDKMQIEQAAAYYEKCYRIRALIVEDAFTVADGENLANIIEILGDLFYNNKDRKRALDYYLEHVTWRETVCQADRTISHMKELGWAYNDVAYEYYCSEKTEDKLAALEYYEKCMPILEDLLKSEWDWTICWHLADDYKYCMRLLGEKKDPDTQKKVIKYAHRAWELYERRACHEHTEDAYFVWYIMLKEYYEITPVPMEKRKAIEKSLKTAEILYELTKDKKYKMSAAADKLILTSENWKKNF